MFRQIGLVEDEPNGNVKITRNGQVLIIHPHHTKDVTDVDELLAIRHFLEKTENGTGALAAPLHLLLVIDHHEARLFRSELHGSVPQQIMPHKPDDFFRHAHHSKEFSRGQEKPDPNSFFEEICSALHGAGKVLVFGTGTGTSSEMDQFLSWIKSQRPELAKRIMGSVVVDENHLSMDQLLAKARDFYLHARPSLT